MLYVAFLRGINVGKKNWIPMSLLKEKMESLGLRDVKTYINSGNVIFESPDPAEMIKNRVETMLAGHFSEAVPVIVMKKPDLTEINSAVPDSWQNDQMQRTDVALLFPEIDHEDTLAELPFKKEYVSVIYTKGAIIWNIKRENVMKSRLAKIIGHRLYPFITIRNINTIRYLAKI